MESVSPVLLSRRFGAAIMLQWLLRDTCARRASLPAHVGARDEMRARLHVRVLAGQVDEQLGLNSGFTRSRRTRSAVAALRRRIYGLGQGA
mmetsp:Transcript_7491/g.22194  ORF Transcript_7491/g.22194 Transcript_7491/m.22194 type:complete len:91 (-) Transcript_7491:65-337(-)